MAMQENDRVGDEPTNEFGTQVVIPAREVDMLVILRRILPVLAVQGVNFLSPSYRHIDGDLNSTDICIGTLAKPFRLAVKNKHFNIYSVRSRHPLKSIKIYYDKDGLVSTLTLATVVAVLNKMGITQYKSSIDKYLGI
jgi:hypothetical protein